MSFLAISFPKLIISAPQRDQLNDSTSFIDDLELMFPPTNGIDQYLNPLFHHQQYHRDDYVHEILKLKHEKCEISQLKKIYQDNQLASLKTVQERSWQNEMINSYFRWL